MVREPSPGIVLACCLLSIACGAFVRVATAGEVTRIVAGPDAYRHAQTALVNAAPGDVVEFGAGRFEFDATLSLDVSGVTIRGQGESQTVLSFASQQQGTGGEGILVSAKRLVTIEDLAVEDAKGDAIKVSGCHGITLRRVRVGWSGGPQETNGSYGLYPVLCQDVLVEDCIARDASDAGIYVGQSENIIVRRNRAERNVAGIEIENSVSADVYENVVTDNASGILVFSLPDLERKNGRRCRIFNNRVNANNHANFAARGNIVADVPSGTGMMILASREVEIFENRFEDNAGAGLIIGSYQITSRPFTDAEYDPFSASIYVHDNEFHGGGDKPSGTLGVLIARLLGGRLPDIVYDGIVDEARKVDGRLPDELAIRIDNNGDADFANIDYKNLGVGNLLGFGRSTISRDLAPHAGTPPRLPEVQIRAATAAEIAALPRRTAPADAPNRLAEYGLFEGNGSTQQPVAGVVPYDLNTPLFSDYTDKFRFVKLPPGQRAKYDASESFNFPVGTLIAKTFAYPRDARDPSQGRRLLETRILKREPDGWIGLPYIWNEEQTEAVLEVAGRMLDVSWIDALGREQTNNYIIPNSNQCKGCHGLDGENQPIGTKARHLNKDFAYAHGAANQLAHWTELGLLSGAPRAEAAPRLPVWNDAATGNVDQRARAYLEVNCAHCHNPRGPARNSGLDLMSSQTSPTKYGVYKTPVATGRGSAGLSYSIVPGKPDHSILQHRIESLDPGVMMPELGKRLLHSEGADLIRQWIAEMPPAGLPGR